MCQITFLSQGKMRLQLLIQLLSGLRIIFNALLSQGDVQITVWLISVSHGKFWQKQSTHKKSLRQPARRRRFAGRLRNRKDEVSARRRDGVNQSHAAVGDHFCARNSLCEGCTALLGHWGSQCKVLGKWGQKWQVSLCSFLEIKPTHDSSFHW